MVHKTHVCCVLLKFATSRFLISSVLFHWHWGYHIIVLVPMKQPWRIWVTGACESTKMITAKYSKTNPWAYLVRYPLQTLPDLYVILPET